MKTLLKWIRTYPVLASVLAWNLGALSVFAGSRPDLLPITASLFFLLALCWMAHAWWDSKRIIVVALLLAVGTPVRAGGDDVNSVVPGGVILGATVIVIGGIIYYGLRKICEKFFPPPPKTPPPNEDEDDGEASAEPPVTVAMTYGDPRESYCLQAASVRTPVGISLTIVADAVPRIESIQITKLLTEEEYLDALRPHGLEFSTQPTYSSNGRPSEAVGIGVQSGRVVVGDGARTITIETSRDLLQWDPLYATSVPAGARLVVSEVVYGASFYRVIAQ